VACTDDYAKLAKATTQPAPTQSSYASTLITWPAANEESTATLSQRARGRSRPLRCADLGFQRPGRRVLQRQATGGIEDLQNDGTREQQAAQASSALKSAAQAAVAAVSEGSFPDTASLVETITAQGFCIEQATDLSEVKDTGTMYVVTSQTSKKRLVIALKNTKGAFKAATQTGLGEGHDHQAVILATRPQRSLGPLSTSSQARGRH
jgi:hypothetical protein